MKWTKDKINECTPDGIENVKRTLTKYGENKWWELENKAEMAKWQMFEPILMVDFSSFHEGIETLLGHIVFTHEFATMNCELKNEVKALCM